MLVFLENGRALLALKGHGNDLSLEAAGLLRGLGVGSYMGVTAPPNKEMGGVVFDNHGGVTMVSGTLDYGQGHAAPFAQVLYSKLGIPFKKVKLIQG